MAGYSTALLVLFIGDMIVISSSPALTKGAVSTHNHKNKWDINIVPESERNAL